MYTIIDIETTGNGIKGNKITEISIFKFDGNEIVDEFTTLVNPEAEIPYFITGLTGIDNAMVRNAPKFHEITDAILKITEETIFVAHNVSFDYNIIKHEFNSVGIDFNRKKLCTVRLSRKLIPGYNSYSLGKLCTSLRIPLTDRHRARGDAHATTLLFKKLLQTEGADMVFKSYLNARSQVTTLPPGLPKSDFEKLPNKPGIYYFKNSKGKIIYVGKAINLKKRVLSHFYDKTTKEIQMCQETTGIDFELSGSEIVALLMESDAIKHHYPEFNRSQKRKVEAFGIFSYEDRNGVLHLAWNTLKMAPNAFYTLYSKTDSRIFLQELCKEYKLCPKFCHLQENVNQCSHYDILECEGICRGTEPIANYNTKVKKAINTMRQKNENYLIKEKGRSQDESAVIVIQESSYIGYGFIDNETSLQHIDDVLPFVKRQKNTFETERLIASFVSKNSSKVFSFKE